MKITGTALAATAAALVAVTGATGAAQAGKKHVHISIGGGHFAKHHFHRRHVFIGSPIHYGDGCGYEKRMWWKTGSYYWKKEYYLCKGWW